MKKFLAGFLMADCAPMDWLVKPVLLLGFRLYVAWVFFKSGLTKVSDSFQVTETTIYLFEEYNVPFLSPEVAAYLASHAELILPALLVIGLISRPAALALFILNAVAAYVFVQAEYHTNGAGEALAWLGHVGDWQHIVWGVMLAVVFAFGPGALSIDKLLSNRWKNS